MKNFYVSTLLFFNLFVFSVLQAQNVGVGTNVPDNSAKLDISSTNRGLLIPRINLSDVSVASPIIGPANGLLVFNTNATITGGNGEGFYYWNGTAWVKLIDSIAPQQSLSNGTGIATLSYDGSSAASINLANTTVTSGIYGDATTYPTFTVNPQGQLTAAGTLALPTTLPPSGAAGGDLTNTYPNPTIAQLQGIPLSTASPSIGQYIQYNGTSWVPVSPTNTLNSSVNTMTSVSNGVSASAPIINTNTVTLDKTNGIRTSVNGVQATQNLSSGTVTDVMGFDGSGAATYTPVTSILGGATTNTISNPVNTITSTVNGITATTTAVNTVANTSSGNNLTTTVNGVAGTSVPMVNSNTIALTKTGGLVSDVNGVSTTQAIATGTLTDVVGFDGTGAAVNQPLSTLLGGATSNAISNPVNTITSTVNGITATTTAVNTNTLSSAVNTMTNATNGISASAPIINTNTVTLDKANGIKTDVNGITSTQAIAAGTITDVVGFDGTGTATYTPVTAILGGATTNTISNPANIITSTINGITATTTAVNTNTLSSTINTMTNATNGVSASAPIVNSISNTSTGNNLTTTVNGVAATAVPMINSNAIALTKTGGLVSDVNGVSTTQPIAVGTLTDVVGFDGTGAAVNQPLSTLLGGATSNAITNPVNTITSTVNGITATTTAVNTNTLSSAVNTMTNATNGVSASAPIVNSISNTSSGNNLTTTVNGVAGTAVPMINSNAIALTKTGGLVSDVNGVSTTQPIAVGTLTDVVGFDGTGAAVNQPLSTLLGGATSNTISNPVNTITSTVNGITATTTAVNTNTLSSAVNTMTNATNGVSASAPIVNSISNTSSGNNLTTTVNGVAATAVPMVNSNTIALTKTGGLVSDVNGVSTTQPIAIGTLTDVVGFDGTGAAVNQPLSTLLGGATSNAISNPVNTITSTVNGITATTTAVNTNTLSSAVNTMTNATNGVSASAPIVNSISNTSSGNNLTTTVNGVAGTAVPMINSNAIALTKTGGLVSDVNGVSTTQVIATGTLTDVVGFDGTGAAVNQPLSTLLGGATSNAITNPVNTITSTVNGITATTMAVNTNTLSSAVNTMTNATNGVSASAPIVNSISNTSTGNNLTTTVNGVAGTSVPMVNSNAIALTKTGGLVSDVNGVSTAQPIAVGTLTDVVGFDGTGAAVNQPLSTLLGGATSNTISNPVNTITSTVNGITATTTAVNTNTLSSAVNTMTNATNGVSASAPIINSNTLSSAVNTMTNATNGVSASAPIVNSISNTSTGNNLTTTVNGVAGTSVPMINSNAIALTKTGGLVSDVNGVSTTQVIATGTLTDVVGFDGTGAAVNQPLSTLLGGATSNAITNPVNTITSTVNGITATTTAVNTNTLSSAVNTMTNATNGVSASAPIINSNAVTLDKANGIKTDVNGVTSTQAIATGTITDVVGFDGTGAAVNQPLSTLLGGATSNTITNPVNTITSTVNGITATTTAVNTNTLSSAVNTMTNATNGVSASAPIVNSISNTSSGNNLTTTVNGVAGTAVPMVNSNAIALTKTGGLVSDVNGISTAQPIAVGTLTDVVGFDGTGAAVNQPLSTLLGGATSNAITNPVNTITSTVNGITATTTAVNTVANASSGNNLTTTVNGVAGTSVPIINTNTLSSAVNTMTNATNGVSASAPIINSNAVTLDKANGIKTDVNGVTSTQAIATGTITDVVGFDGTGAAVNQPLSTLLGGATSNAITNPVNTITSTVNGITATTTAVNTVANGSSGNNLTTSVNGVAGTSVPIINTNTLSSAANTMTNATNGVSASAPIINSNAVTLDKANGIKTDVNGVTSTQAIAAGTITDVVGFDGTGAAVNQPLSTLLGGATSNAITNPVNTITSTVNGITATTTAVNTVANGSSGNNLTTSVNGVAGTSVPIINTNTLSSAANTMTNATNGVSASAPIINSNTVTLDKANGIKSDVNGVTSTQAIATGTITDVVGFDGTGAAVNQPLSTLLGGATSNAISNPVNTITSTVNGITATTTAVNTNTLSSAVNTMTNATNGVSASAPIINSNAVTLDKANGIKSDVNGVTSTQAIATGTITDVVGFDGTGAAVNQPLSTLLGGATSNAITNPVNTITSTVNGITATTTAVNTNTLSSAVNTMTNATNGVSASAPIINSNAVTLDKANGIKSDVNGVTSTQAIAAGTITDVVGFDGTGAAVNQPLSTLLGGATSNAITNPVNTITSTVNGITATTTAVNTVANGSSGNNLTTSVNGVAGTSVPIINTNTLSSAANTMTNATNGVSASAPIINSNAVTLDKANGIKSDVNGVTSTQAIAAGTITDVVGFDGTGAAVNQPLSTLLGGATSNAITNPVNTITSTVNGITATTTAVNTNTLSSAVNTMTNATNGVSASAPIINSNAVTLDKANGIKSDVNGVTSTQAIATGTITDVVGFDGTGAAVNQPLSTLLGGATSNAITNPVNTITSTVNGITATTTAVNTVANGSSGNNLTTSVNGVAGTSVPIINTNTLSSAVNTMTNATNGVSASAPIINSNAVTLDKANGIKTDVNGVTSTQAIATGTITDVVGFDGTGAAVNQPLSTLLGGATSNAITNPVNTITSTVNGITATTTAVNTNTLSSAINTMTNATNGVSASAPIINSNAVTLDKANGIKSDVNGVTSTQAIAAGTITDVVGFDGTGAAVNQPLSTLLGGATSNAITNPVNTITSTVNGITATTTAVNTNTLSSAVNTMTNATNGVSASAPIINSNTLSSAANTMTNATNGVSASAPIINSNAVTLDKANGIKTDVNGVTSTQAIATGTITDVVGFDGTGAAVNQPLSTLLGGATSNAITNPVNTITSTVNGITATTTAVNTVTNTSSANDLTTTVNGIAGSSVPIINTNTLTTSGGTSIVSTVNGVASAAVDVNPLITKSDFTETTSSVLMITGGTGAVLGTGTTIQVKNNALGQAGVVTAPTITNANQVWGTDGAGNPGWITTNGAIVKKDVVSTNPNLTITNGANQVVGATNVSLDLTTGALTSTTSGVTIGGTGTTVGSNITIDIATNSKTTYGLVTPTTGLANKIWASNALGDPDWRDGNSLLTTKDIVPNTGSVLSVTNGTGQVVGATNVTVDIQGTNGGVLYGAGAGTAAAFSAAGTSGQILQSNGAAAPTWVNASAALGTDVDANDGLTITYPDVDVNVSNGIQLVSDNVKLGGALDQNTTVTQGNFEMTYDMTGTGNFEVRKSGATDVFVSASTGSVGIGTATPTAAYLMSMVPNGSLINGINMTISSGASPTGINMALSGGSGTGTGLNISATNANYNGVLVSNSSAANASFYGVGSVLSAGNIVSGYTGYRNVSGLSYGLYGVNGTTGTYATSTNTWAAFLQGRTVISAESSPTSGVGTDLEVRNTTAGAGNPATVSMRQSTSNTTSNTVLTNLNFGDNNATAPQAQIQVIRDAASSSSTDLPTAIAVSTTPDGSATMAERMRITNTGNIGINTTNPGARLTVNGGLATSPSTSAAAATITIPANVSTFYITDNAAANANAISATSPVEGQVLSITNLDAQDATFSGATIPASSGVGAFQYVNGAWRIVGVTSGTGNDWTKANTTSTLAAKTDNQYVTGNVGVGNFSASSPATQLHVKAASGNGFLTIDNSAAASQSGINFYTNGTGKANVYYDPSTSYGAYGGILINDYGASSPNTIINRAGGAVGIGTNLPGATLNVIHPTVNTTPTKPTGNWTAIIENNQDAADSRNGLAVATRWGSNASTIFEAATYWNGGAQAYTPILSVLGDRTVRITNAGTTAASPATYPLQVQRAGVTDLTLGSDASFGYLQTWNSKPLLINSQGNNVGIGITGAPAVKLAVNGNGTNVYNTDIWTENNIHVQGNETMTAGGRGRLRIGSAWGYNGLYTDGTSTAANNDLVLGASSGTVRVGPGSAIAQQNLFVSGRITAQDYGAAGSQNILIGDDTYFTDLDIADITGLYGVGNPAVGGLQLGSNSGSLLYGSGGNIGVGMTAPNDKLDVVGSAQVSTYLKVGNPVAPATQNLPGLSTLWNMNFNSNLTFSTSLVCGATNWGGFISTTNKNFMRFTPPASRAVARLFTPWIWVPTGSTSHILDFYFNRAFGDNSFDGAFMEMTTNGTTFNLLTPSFGTAYAATTGTSPTNCAANYSSSAWSGTHTNVNAGFQTFPVTLPGKWVRFSVCAIADASAAGGAFEVYGMGLNCVLPTGLANGTFQNGNVYAEKNVFAGSNVLMGDVAEYFKVNGTVESGMLVSLSTTGNDQYEMTRAKNDAKVIGIISTAPTLTINNPNSGSPVALSGRVPVFVTNENGEIKAGDYLTSSSKPGYAMKATGNCYVIGKAVESFNESQGKVVCLIDNGWMNLGGASENMASGEFFIPKGQNKVIVKDASISKAAKVFVSLLDNANASYYLSKKEEGFFELSFNKVMENDIHFDYFVMNATSKATTETKELEPKKEVVDAEENEKGGKITKAEKEKIVRNGQLFEEAREIPLPVISAEDMKVPPTPIDPTKAWKWENGKMTEFTPEPKASTELR